MKKFVLAISILLLGCIAYVACILSYSNTKVTNEKSFVYIPTNSNYKDLLQILTDSNFIKDINSFDNMAHRLNFVDVKPGRYQIKSGMGNYSLVNMFKGGKQVPVKLVINKLRTQGDIIRKISSQLEADSASLYQLFNDTAFLCQNEISAPQLQALIMPDTYQFYWNTEPSKILAKIIKNYKKFWTEERKAKAQKLNLSPVDIITIASIVEEETNYADDKLKIASTYLNRLHIGMPLQADPTVKFAVNDFTIKRVLTKHTQTISPYNTYMNKGLPPGPICTPSRASIDAVLNAPKTDYLYFCADENLNGKSNFASTYAEHQGNAKRYQAALNARNIMR